MGKQISIKEAIVYAVNAVVSHPWYFIKLLCAWIGLSIILVIVPAFILIAMGTNSFSPLIIGIAYFVLYVMGIFVWFLPAKLLLRFYDNGPEPFSLDLFFSQFNVHTLLKLLCVSILYYVAIGAGLILLIIPGIYLAIKFIFAFLTLVDTDCGIIEAFKRSYTITTGNFVRILGLIIIAGLLFNLLITAPVALLMMIHAYRQVQPAGFRSS